MPLKAANKRNQKKAKSAESNQLEADMGRKRKIPLAGEEKENASAANKEAMLNNGPIYTIMSKVQLNEAYHKKYAKELRQIYEKMNHDAFIFTFIKIIKSAMAAEETNEFAYTTLIFCAKFVSAFEGEDTQPLLADICRWLLTTISNSPHIRFRLCQFVNMILNALGNEATLDDVICDSIMEYMVGRLVDVSSSVRVQAILAMHRLQVPDNPDDSVLRAYQYHLCSDPAPRVRQAVITSMGRNYHTIPYILDRLWDIDEKVRRHTYVHMSSYPVRSYKVSQRLTLLEQGLNDRSELVRKVVTNIMLQQWIESYQKDLLALLGALKLDSSEAEICRFRKIGRQVLFEIFKRQNKADIVACIDLEEGGEYYRCIPYERLSLEKAFYWQCLSEYLQNEMAEEFDQVLPELSVFCAYVETFYKTCNASTDKFEAMEFQFKLLSLMEILYIYDLGDEIGRGKLHNLLQYLLKDCILDEKVIVVIVKCSENLIADQNLRHQFFLDIIHDICSLNSKQQDSVHDRNLISELLQHSTDADLNLKLSSLKVEILELEEQEMNYVQNKEYAKAQQIIEAKNLLTEEFTNLLRPLLEIRNKNLGDSAQPQFTKVVKNESILQSLQIAYYMVVSKSVKSLQHSTCRLYNDFIYRNMASNQIAIRDWALKCGTAFSMIYEPLAKDVFEELYSQFFKNHNIRIWETSITCIFELLDRYGVDNFTVSEGQNKSKKTGRQLYNTLEFIDENEDESRQSTTLGQGVGVIYMMSHFLDTCDDMCIIRSIVNGFCRLVLHGLIDNREIVEKLLLRYFNPATDAEINQILGVFLENLIQQRKQNLLHPCLMITVNSVISAPYDSPLHDIRPENITRFIIDATRPDTANVSTTNVENAHNKLAVVFLNEMINNTNNKDLCKLLSKELITLEINVLQQEELKNDMKKLCDKLIKKKFDPRFVKNIIDFKNMLDGVFNPPPKRSTYLDSDDEDNENETNPATENMENITEENTQSTTATNSAERSDNNATLVAEEPINPTNESQSEETSTTLVAEEPINPSNDSQSKETSAKLIGGCASNAINGSPTDKISARPAGKEPASPTCKTLAELPVIAHIETIMPPIPNTTPTTYGSDNVTSHRLLRRSLNLSRNSSVDSNSTANNDQMVKPSKIRIEARIDSDKKTKESSTSNERMNSKARRSLRLNRPDQNETDSAKPREPEIIEKILSSPLKLASTSKSLNTEPHPTEKQNTETNRNTQPTPINIEKEKEVNKTNNSSSIISDAELDKSEVIPESPIVSSPKILNKPTRLKRGRNPVKNTKSSSSGVEEAAPAQSTPLRNGRKRVLQLSPTGDTASPTITSPTRKQSCFEKNTTANSTSRRSRSRRSMHTTEVEKTLQPTTATTGTTESVIAATSNKENERRKSLTPSNKTTSAVLVKSSKKKTSENQTSSIKPIPTVTTRNTAKIDRITKTIMTRERLSQENLTTEALYAKSSAALKSRIPVKARNVENSKDKPVQKKSNEQNPRLPTSTRIPSVRLLGLRKKLHSSTSTTSSQSGGLLSGRHTRRRVV